MMILQREFILKIHRTLLKTGLTLSLAMIGLCLSAAVHQAQAQQTPYYDLSTPEVTVDLSVLGDGGLGGPRVGAVSPHVGGGTLLMPGGQLPTSRLLVTPPRKPSAASRAPQQTVKRKPRKARATPKPVKTAAKPATKPAPKKKRKTKSTETVVAQKPDSAPVSVAPPPPPAIPGAPDIAKTPPPPPAPATPTSLEPEKKTAAAATASTTQQATTSPTVPPKPSADGKSVQVVFSENSAKVPGATTAKLKSLADALKATDTLRLQLRAYAGGKDMTPSKARRLSLSRALAVRSQLISAGVRSTRIDVRALGNKTTEEPLNRVDVAIVER